jgi:hypothetical protein
MSDSDLRDDHGRNVSLADEEAVKQILVDSVFGLWDAVNNLTRLRPSKRDRYRATIFGSARASLGRLLTRRSSESPRRWPNSAATSSRAAVRV